MKRIILLTIGLMFVISIPFNISNSNIMEGPDLSITTIEEDVNILRKIIIMENDPMDEVIAYCDNKVKIGMAAYFRRESGATLEEVLETVKNSKKQIEAKGEKVFNPLYIESLRMTRDVFRHPEYDHNDTFNRFYRECIDLEF